MSFFGDLKTITKASLKAVGSSVELIAEAAENAERASARLVLTSSAKNLESTFNRQADNGAGRWELEKIWLQLSEIYDELWKDLTRIERDEITRKRSQYLSRISSLKISDLETEIKQEKNQISKGLYRLPIHEISALNSLKHTQKQLAKLLVDRGDVVRPKELTAECGHIDLRIAELEEKRNELIVEHYPDGQAKRHLPRRDGQLHGQVESWYQGGAKESQFRCSGEKFNGVVAQYWREDGSLVCSIESPGKGVIKDRLFLQDGQIIWECELKGKQGVGSFWLWDGFYLGKAKVIDGRVARYRLFFSIFVKPGFWLRVFKMCRNKNELSKAYQMNDTITQWTNFRTEIEKVIKS